MCFLEDRNGTAVADIAEITSIKAGIRTVQFMYYPMGADLSFQNWIIQQLP